MKSEKEKIGTLPNTTQLTQKELESKHGISANDLKKKFDERADRFDFELPVISEEYQAKLRGDNLTETERIFKRAFFNTQRPQKEIEFILSYQDARKLAWFICQEKAKVLNIDFKVDDTNRLLLTNLTKYFTNDETGDFDLRKGLFLSGDVGLGKTLLLSIFQDFAKATKKKEFKIIPCVDVFDDVSIAQNKNDNPLKNFFKYYSNTICFDDLGQEPTLLKSFGNEIPVMEKILTERYKRFINGNCITHITSNLSQADLKEKYGIRVFDRCKEMFEFIHMAGASKRK